ncbi:hypothetical protein BJ741DRAFT_655471 [Chytriomyces cf. hyalinus JEL632]|nr:hypothetical protein BJ741DRAFT_655471 [Chytriomyces cf. hyalinus JEL632]
MGCIGLQAILKERGLLVPETLLFKCKDCSKRNHNLIKQESLSSNCCGFKLILQEPNFQEGIAGFKVQDVINARGRLCILLPKFHYAKGHIKERAIAYANRQDALIQAVSDGVSKITRVTVARIFRHIHRWHDAYAKGLSLSQAQYAVCQYKRHRSIPDSFLHDSLKLVPEGQTRKKKRKEDFATAVDLRSAMSSFSSEVLATASKLAEAAAVEGWATIGGVLVKCAWKKKRVQVPQVEARFNISIPLNTTLLLLYIHSENAASRSLVTG